MRKISVADPVIYGVFVLAAGILVHHMMPDVMLNLLKPFTSLYSQSLYGPFAAYLTTLLSS